jgi:glycosyltransferase involved in cell wall biosynthesis
VSTNKKLNILYIITKLELGGAQKVCLELCKNLQAAGHKTLLISGAEGQLVAQLPNYIPDSSHIILLSSFKREVNLKNLWLEFKNFYNLILQIKQLKKTYPDLIVHAHSTKAGLLGRWAAFFAGVKKRVYTIHGYGFNQYQPKLVAGAIYFLELITSFVTTDYVCVSELDLTIGAKLFPGFKRKAKLIRAGVDDQLFVAAKVDGANFTFGTVACFKPQKNLFDLLRAFNHLKILDPANNYKLEIVGDGALRSEIETWINAHNLQNNIILHGWQAPEKLPSIMAQWHCFTLSSLWEGLPCAIVEARCLKLPVLAYNTGGISEIIFNNKNGFLYVQGDWLGLANGMYNLAHDHKLYQKLSNYPDDLSSYSYSYMAQAHIDLYLAEKD